MTAAIKPTLASFPLPICRRLCLRDEYIETDLDPGSKSPSLSRLPVQEGIMERDLAPMLTLVSSPPSRASLLLHVALVNVVAENEVDPALLPSPAVLRVILSSKSVQLKAPALPTSEVAADEVGATGSAGGSAAASTDTAAVAAPTAAALRPLLVGTPKLDDLLAIRLSIADTATTPGLICCLSFASTGDGADVSAATS